MSGKKVTSLQIWKVRHGLLVGAHGSIDRLPPDPMMKKLYRCWLSMKTRCFNPNSKPYADYGGRGITVCEAWRNSFVQFRRDMGDPPSGELSIGRINNDGNYEPSNCRWETRRQQTANRRTTVFKTINGKTQCIAEWARESGLTPECIGERIKRGDPEDKLLRPLHQRVRYA